MKDCVTVGLFFLRYLLVASQQTLTASFILRRLQAPWYRLFIPWRLPVDVATIIHKHSQQLINVKQ